MYVCVCVCVCVCACVRAHLIITINNQRYNVLLILL